MPSVEQKDLERALNAADYPADKDALLAEARGHGAGEDVLRAVRSLPNEEYGSFAEVLRSVHPTVTNGHVPTRPLDPSSGPANPNISTTQT